MPELPEVETIRKKLEKDIVGKTIKNIEIREKKQFIGDKKYILGQKITNLERVGKILAFKLSNNKFLNFHLKLTGQILYTKDLKNPVFENIIPFTKTKIMPANTTRIIFTFSDGSGIFFNDLRKFAWVKVSDKHEKPNSVDIISKDFTLEYFTKAISTSRKPIKILLMEQDKMAGIGNIYANDALFLASINPLRKSLSLKEEEIKKLYEAVKKVINEGLEDQGSSGADEAYILPDGSKGTHQRHFLVYQKEGELCLKECGGIVKRIKQGGRSSFYCPNCQKL